MKIIRKAALAAAVIMTGLMSGCYFFPAEEALLDPPVTAPDKVAYSTFTARTKDLESSVIVTGYVRSHTEKECYFTDYTGRVKTVYVKPGDMVSEGDLIAEMNTGALEYELKIQELKVEAAQLRYNSTGSEADKLQLEIEQSTLDMYRAEEAGARIYAPISGQVSYVFKMDPGTEMDPYRVIARIVDPGDLYIAAEYDGDQRNFSVGDRVTVTVDGYLYDCEISYTPKEAKADAADNTKALYAEFTGERPSFAYLGSLADIKKVKEIAEGAVVIPKNLVKTDGDRTFVQIFEDGEKTERDVVTGISNATEVEIKDGLKAGDAVIIR